MNGVFGREFTGTCFELLVILPNWFVVFVKEEKDFVHAENSLTVPTSGKRYPAPALARMSLIGKTKPVGTPFLSAS